MTKIWHTLEEPKISLVVMKLLKNSQEPNYNIRNVRFLTLFHRIMKTFGAPQGWGRAACENKYKKLSHSNQRRHSIQIFLHETLEFPSERDATLELHVYIINKLYEE